MELTKTHWRKIDYRKDTLEAVIEGISNSLGRLRNRLYSDPNYGGLLYHEDTEQVIGLAFVAFQIYINGSIFDLYHTLSNKEKFYKIIPNKENLETTKIELIISISNYFKHKDDEKLGQKTEKIIRSYELLDYSNPIKSPILDALEILTKNFYLAEILEHLYEWREKLFKEFEKTLT